MAWKVKHRNGWCAGKDRRPAEATTNWPTLRNHFVVLPGKWLDGTDFVDCPDCLKALPPATQGKEE